MNTKGGCGRSSSDVEGNAKGWGFCVLMCMALILLAILSGCKPRNEDDAGRSLRKQFNGM